MADIAPRPLPPLLPPSPFLKGAEEEEEEGERGAQGGHT